MIRLPIVFLICLRFYIPNSHSAPKIVEFTRSGLITWTNLVADASYRLESSAEITGPYVILTNFTTKGTQGSVQTEPISTTGMNFFRIAWTDAPMPHPTEEWIYEGYDPSGQLSVTGLVTFAQSGGGTGDFKSIVGLSARHRTGAYTISTVNILQGNWVIPILQPDGSSGWFSLSGVMVLDEYVGGWNFSEQVIRLDGQSEFITYTGRFVAKRKS